MRWVRVGFVRQWDMEHSIVSKWGSLLEYPSERVRVLVRVRVVDFSGYRARIRVKVWDNKKCNIRLSQEQGSSFEH